MPGSRVRGKAQRLQHHSRGDERARDPGSKTQKPHQVAIQTLGNIRCGHHHGHNPRTPIAMNAILTANTISTATKTTRSLPGEMNASRRAPRTAPTTEPKATGPAISGTIAPRMK